MTKNRRLKSKATYYKEQKVAPSFAETCSSIQWNQPFKQINADKCSNLDQHITKSSRLPLHLQQSSHQSKSSTGQLQHRLHTIRPVRGQIKIACEDHLDTHITTSIAPADNASKVVLTRGAALDGEGSPAVALAGVFARGARA